jgi:hypothetical protein
MVDESASHRPEPPPCGHPRKKSPGETATLRGIVVAIVCVAIAVVLLASLVVMWADAAGRAVHVAAAVRDASA